MRRRAALKILFVLLFVSACGDDDPVGPAGPVPAAMVGTVTDQATGDPVAAAVVQIGDTAMTTGGDGRYALGDLTPGLATLRCSAPGSPRRARTVRRPRSDRNNASGRARAGL